MKVYVIITECKTTGDIKVSQEGYSSYEAAVAFINRRSDNPVKIDYWYYEGNSYFYEIKEISIH